MNTHRIYLACQLSQGSFSGEAVFEFKTIDNGLYVGVAPLRDCLTLDGRIFEPGELPRNGTVEGKVVTRLIANGGDVARVALPDGEDVKVSAALVSEREAEISHVAPLL